MNTLTQLFGRPTTRRKMETVKNSGIYIDTVRYGHIGYLGQLYYKAVYSLVKALYLLHTPTFEYRYKHFGVSDIEFDGINHSDYPDYCDAYVSSAYWNDTSEALTDEELDNLSNMNDMYDKLVDYII